MDIYILHSHKYNLHPANTPTVPHTTNSAKSAKHKLQKLALQVNRRIHVVPKNMTSVLNSLAACSSQQ